jgi:Protein of unknwon function (DUF3310)
MAKELINHPPHYTAAAIEPIDVIEDWKLGFHLGNVVKYLARAEHKGAPLEDLQKAAWYLNREIQRRTKRSKPRRKSTRKRRRCTTPFSRPSVPLVL